MDCKKVIKQRCTIFAIQNHDLMKFLVTNFLLFALFTGYAQDYIVYKTGEVVYCDIKREKEEVLYVEYRFQNDILNGIVFKSHLKEFETDVFPNSYVYMPVQRYNLVKIYKDVETDRRINQPNQIPDSSFLDDSHPNVVLPQKDPRDFNANDSQFPEGRVEGYEDVGTPSFEYKSRINKQSFVRFNGGYAHMFIPSGVYPPGYANQLRHGWHAGADLDFIIKNGSGFGFKMRRTRTKANFFYGFSDNITVNYYAMKYVFSSYFGISNVRYTVNLGLGALHYFNRVNGGRLSSITPGLNLGYSFDFPVIKNFLDLGLQFDYFGTATTKYTYEKGSSSTVITTGHDIHLYQRGDIGLGIVLWF